MNIPVSTYYKLPDAERNKQQAQSDASVLRAIERVLSDWPSYGYRRVTAELRRRGIVINHKRIARVMRENNLNVKPRKRRGDGSETVTGSPYPNLAKGFVADGPDQLWVGDITYIRLRSGFVYLAVLIDAWSRRVVGYAVSRGMDVRLTLAALEAAVRLRNPRPGLTHHSDRGSQYLAKGYQQRLSELAIRGSMSRPGTPTDNPQAESFMKTLKHEEIYALDYETLNDVKNRLPRFIDDIYNRRRIHSALGYVPPVEFEQKYASEGV